MSAENPPLKCARCGCRDLIVVNVVKVSDNECRVHRRCRHCERRSTVIETYPRKLDVQTWQERLIHG